MVRKHIRRDFSAHKKEIIRPRDEYAKIEIFSFDPSLDEYYFVNHKISSSDCKNITKTSWRSWNAFTSKDWENRMEINIKYNVKETGDYRIDYLYEQSSYIIPNNDKRNTDKDLLGKYSITQGKSKLLEDNVVFDGENQILKRQSIYHHFQEGVINLHFEVPFNCYFYGIVIRKIIKYVGLNDYSGESLDDGNLMFTGADFTQSSDTKPAELQFTIGYDYAYECEEKPSGFYIDYMDEVNYYIKDDDGEIERVFGGYVSSVLPDDNRTKLTIHCADRLIDGQDKYILEELVLKGGTKKLSENEYDEGMEKSFETYAEVLKFLCDSHEVTLQSNISKNFTVDGEKFHEGKIITFGSEKDIKSVSPTNGTAVASKNFITLRNNSSGEKEQIFPLWNAKDYGKTPVEITNYPYLHITYGLGDPKTEIKSELTETVDNAEIKAGSQKFGKCGQSEDKQYVMAIAQPSAGKGGYSYSTIYKTVFKNKCPYCGKAELRWDAGRSGTACIYCGGYRGSKRSWGPIPETEITCNNCCADYCGVTGYEKDYGHSTKLTTVTKPVKSSKDEQNKLFNGNMVAVPTTGATVTSDDIFKTITNIAFKYKYKLYGNTTQTYSAMKKAGYGDCWAFSDLIFTELKKYGVSCKIVQYGTNASDAHRSVLYKDKNGSWTDFPYREYGWGSKYDNMLNNTSRSKSGSTIKEYKGTNMGDIKTSSTNTSQTQTTTVTTTKGYDKDVHFQAYLKIEYSLKNNFTSENKSVHIDFTLKSDSEYALSKIPTVWINNEIKKSSLNVNLIDFIRQYEGEKAKIYLQSISFVTPKKTDTTSAKDNTDVDWYKYDDSTVDESSCKMDLYQIVFDDRSEPNPSELNSCGKTVNALIQSIVKEANYLVEMTYGEHRKDDVINFRVPNNSVPVFTATEGDDNNILDWSSITYNPVSTLYNSSVQVYKSANGKYYYVDTHDVESILNYGEHTTLSTSNEQIGSREAYWNAVHSDKYNPVQTYTYSITVPNYPDIRLGDLVQVISNSKRLNTIKEVKSIKIDYDTAKIPRIRTTLGLDELSPDIQMRENIRNLRKKAKDETTSFSSSAIPINDKNIYEWDN